MQDKRGTISTTMRSRKVCFDDYTNAFFVESRLETLKRQIETRSGLTDVLNKSQEARCDFKKRQFDAAKRIFIRKSSMAMTIHRDNLQEYKAHWNVLQDIARKKQRAGLYDEDDLGTYGPGASKVEIQDLIEKKIKQSSPSAKRRRDARKHLNHRNRVEVFDRNLPTSALLKSKVKSRTSTKGGEFRSRRSGIVLPPIAVTFTKQDGEEVGNGVHITTRPATSGRYNDLGLPAVFVTETNHTV
ncbi:uncharacterized protein [Haliotis asinina]|uniref:uncharacterized protein n=1 Tax=Haliotis asinina TaxID=109174 RepID=UPI0035326189